MKNLQKYVVLILCFLSVFLKTAAQDIDVKSWLQTVPLTAKFSLPGYRVWCGSMVKGNDGRYYLFYSRWPEKSGHEAWVTESEIALAVSDCPTGPYKHVKVVLAKREKKYWDADVTHNPTVHSFGKKFYLYYMGNYGNGEFWDHRNHQRIGVAVANSPLGPWVRFDKPIIDTSYKSFDHLMASNPSVAKRSDGKYLMIYKGVGEGKMPFGGTVLHGAALASNPEGPFVKLPNRIFVKDTVKFAAEDPFVWYQEGKYWAIVKDFKGFFTGAGLSLALFESGDGFDWKPAKNVLVTTPRIQWVTGTKNVTRLERPQLWIDKVIPRVLFCAVFDGEENYNVAIPLNATK